MRGWPGVGFRGGQGARDGEDISDRKGWSNLYKAQRVKFEHVDQRPLLAPHFIGVALCCLYGRFQCRPSHPHRPCILVPYIYNSFFIVASKHSVRMAAKQLASMAIFIPCPTASLGGRLKRTMGQSPFTHATAVSTLQAVCSDVEKCSQAHTEYSRPDSMNT